jgi:hypothetical protein
MNTHTDFANPYNQGYRDGEKAQRERTAAAATLTDEALWKVFNSLECTIHWLANGRAVDEAIGELRLNSAMIQGIRKRAS